MSEPILYIKKKFLRKLIINLMKNNEIYQTNYFGLFEEDSLFEDINDFYSYPLNGVQTFVPEVNEENVEIHHSISPLSEQVELTDLSFGVNDFELNEVQEEVESLFVQSTATHTNSITLRWNKYDDIRLFKIIKSELTYSTLTLEHLKKKTRSIALEYKKLLETLIIKAEWKGTIYELRIRIRKVLNNPKLTCRDIRRLKPLLRKHYEGKVSREELLDNFPGRTFAQLVKQVNK